MKLKTKKIIAREIIQLFSVGLLTIIAFLIIYPYNLIYQSKAENLQGLILSKKKLADSLSRYYSLNTLHVDVHFDKVDTASYVPPPPPPHMVRELQLSTKDKLAKLYEVLKLDLSYSNILPKTEDEFRIIMSNKREATKLFQALKTDSTYYSVIPKSFNDFSNALGLSELYNKNKDYQDRATKLNVELKELSIKKQDYETSMFSINEQKRFGIDALIIILIILYPMRLFYYAFVWSYKTLKQNEQQ